MTQDPDRIRLRVAFLGMVFLSLLSALVLRLYSLQVLTHNEYIVAAERNRVRIVPIEPARGRILDRNGEVLVSIRPSRVVSVRPDQVVNRKETFQRLADLLGMTVEEIEERLKDKSVLPYTAIPIKEDVPKEAVVYIEENIDKFQGVLVEDRPIRIYPKGVIAPHLLGYVGEINSEQLELDRYRDYPPGSIIGKSGVEYAYEEYLRGTPGKRKISVDAAGRVIDAIEEERVEPVPGFDIVTSIDARAQTLVEESLADGIETARKVFDEESQKKYLAPAGGAVVLDPQSGEVIAMASYPFYDPGAFVGGISRAEFDALAQDPANPLFNRVTQAAHPPGSTFKIVTALAALQEGVATRGGKYDCPGSIRLYDQTFRNWKSSDSGAITLSEALIQSCNTVFDAFGAEFWKKDRDEPKILQNHARAMGFGARTGIEIGGPFESRGRVPDQEWLIGMNRRFPALFPYSDWLPGYTINMAIGQGDVLATPLQLGQAYSALASGGSVLQPHVGLRVMQGETVVKTVEPKEIRKLTVDPANLDTIRRALEGVPSEGTARDAFAGFPLNSIPVAAKTGTAELQTKPPKQPYAWFAAYAPADDPQYVVVVMLEEGGHGGETAAPIARRIFEGLFDLALSEITPATRTD
ncbi:MAG TPA: penicillin-binding protein 2 [Actinomycetota bacterium]|nr:penicillin-binding protein 2 [Actinomycetota bacterium]